MGIIKLDSGGGAVLEHCPHRTAPLWPYDRSSGQQWQALACSAQALLSTARVLWLKHCPPSCHWPQWCPGHCPGSLSSPDLYDPITASARDFCQMWKIHEQCFSHCSQVLSFTVSTIDKNLLSELWLELPDHRLGHIGTVSRVPAAVLLIKTRHMTLMAINKAKADFRRMVFLSRA